MRAGSRRLFDDAEAGKSEAALLHACTAGSTDETRKKGRKHMGYDAAKALGFAEEFCNRPCRSASHPKGALGLSEAHDVSVDRFWD